MMILLAVYGLRSGEVRNLRLQDIDWDNRVLYVSRPKCRTRASYPLVETVAAAIRRYLEKVRPHSKDDRLFLRMKAPLVGLTSGGLSIMTRTRLKALGIVVTKFVHRMAQP